MNAFPLVPSGMGMGQWKSARNMTDYRLRLRPVSPTTAGAGTFIPASAAHNTSSPTRMTVRIRFFTNGSFINNGLVTRSDLSNNQGDWALGFFNGSSMAPTFRVNNNGAAVQSPTALSGSTWYFIEANYDSSLASNNLKIFVDGVLKVQGNYTTALTNHAAYPIYFLTYFSSNLRVNAQIAEFEFCNNFVRNYVAYTPPTAIVPDAYTTVLYKAMVLP